MGEIEKKYKKIRKRKDLQRIILDVVSSVGVLSVALMAPKALGVLEKMGFLPTKRQKDSIRVARNALVRKGFLRYEGNKLYLTNDGKRRLYLLKKTIDVFSRPHKWDHRWRVLIFDIPEERRSVREKIRRTLSAIGFVRLQDSVWVYPYDCEDFVILLKADFKIGKDLLYMIVDVLEYDISLRKHFELPPPR